MTKIDHEEKEHANLRCTEYQGAHEQVALLQETEELENAKDTDEAEGAYNHEVAHRAEYPTEVERQCTQQGDDAEEAESILARLVCAIEPTQVLQCEEEREDVLQNGEDLLESRWNPLHAFHYDHHNAGHDESQKGNVESLSKWRVALENDDAQLLTQSGVAHGFTP